ncbi:MAG: lysophospholipid transporter LplT [Rubrivivax sp.]|jgi:LPLT family lysophospholipid transporter-like MFS transporter
MPSGFHLLIAAQFVSALADNALLIVAIALLAEQGLPGWWAPMLKFGFTLSYVLLAPFVGALADTFPKARLMAWMNAVKLSGAALMLAGVHPIAGFALVGLGAAAYAPAKYGLIIELVAPRHLVAANGWVEVSVVCAALLGTVIGGVLVSPAGVMTLSEIVPAHGLAWLTDSAHAPGMALLVAGYALASVLNQGIPDSGARYPHREVSVWPMCRDFHHDHLRLWRDPDGGLSLAATTLVWGVAATLQFAVLRWAIDVLGLGLDRAAYLQAAVALGVIAGAAAAGRWVPLHAARRMLPVGIVLGLLLPVVASLDRVALAVPMLMLVGAAGGLLVVPLNALLQHRGHAVLTAGRSIAVQGFNENASVLAMLAVYGSLTAAQMPIRTLMWCFGAFIAAAMGALTWWAARPRSALPR